MVVKDDRIKRPHGNTVIWRYLGLDKFLNLLVTEQLYFSNVSKLTDKYEGVIPKKNANLILNELEKQTRYFTPEEAQFEQSLVLHQTNSLKDLSLVNCWSIDKYESYALWKIFLGGSREGIAIKTTVSRLEKAIKLGKEPEDEDIFMGQINYTDFIKDDPRNRFNVITTKNKFYEYEKELRLFIFHYARSEGGIETSYDISIGRGYKIDINELIESIYLSPFGSEWFEQSLVSIVNKVNPALSDRIRQSEILDQ